MKKIFLIGFTALFTMASCGGNEESTTENENAADSTAVNEGEEVEDTEEASLFEGEERGDYLLYGYTDIDDAEVATVAEMSSQIDAGGNFEGKVSVEISEVCQKAGCWITFNDDEGESVRVFFRDHFTIPPATASGTDAILYGVTSWDTMDVDMQKHLLDDAAEAGEEVSQADYDAITEDKLELVFDCESILVAKQ
ncbi:MAG: DUF4920 domain-containing protein [Flavobacteriales bacterium]|nr:DUF4920 domain-containing protein [Flavobacteriales bacterium]